MKFAALLVLSLLLPLSVRAQAASAPSSSAKSAPATSPSKVVRGWFAAIVRQDFGGAIALTRGAAQTRTERVVGELTLGAAAHHASLEVKVHKLDIQAPPAGSTTPVTARFDIDVIGKRWVFHRLARKLTGVVKFHVATDQHITAIDGRLE